MKVFDDAWSRDDLPTGAVATIGNYDGVHRGQRVVLDRVVARARQLNVAGAVITFEPHPAKVLKPDWAPRRLTTAAQKEALLSACGIDLLFLLRFDAEFARVSARDFVDRFLFGRLDLREILVGSRFAFGKAREGDLALLRSLAVAAGRDRSSVHGVEEIVAGSAPISSTRIREAVLTGRVEAAQELLGRPYELEGRVVRGAGKGRDLGWPTINIDSPNELIPAHGVYVTLVRFEDSTGSLVVQPSVSNVGVRPTLHSDSKTTVECHLLDFDRDIYGMAVSVQFLERLRGERAFPSLDALRAQIGADVAAARARFARAGGSETLDRAGAISARPIAPKQAGLK